MFGGMGESVDFKCPWGGGGCPCTREESSFVPLKSLFRGQEDTSAPERQNSENAVCHYCGEKIHL